MNNKAHRYWDKLAIEFAKTRKKKEARYAECYKIVSEYLNQESELIDLGCGIGHMSFQLSSNVKSIHAIDFSEAMISMAKAQKRSPEHDNILFEQGNIEYTGLKENSKDAGILCNVLHHIENPSIVLKEAKRVIKPNGIIITSTVCIWNIRSLKGTLKFIKAIFQKLLNKIPHLRLYNIKSLKKTLESSGMLIIAEKQLKINGDTILFAILKT